MRRLRVVAVLAAAAVAAACSSATEPPGESTPSSAVPSVGHGSFAYCLSQHGIPAPPGPASGPPPGVDAAAWEAAMAECSSLAPGPAG
ncbi:hypothetical protein C6A85_000000109940 [Mycobacterium sp. ITM-2017-0098]|nr:hypothetical protein C6A85_000000109940 [Mycobacterium sp. ITM-2017-0098]